MLYMTVCCDEISIILINKIPKSGLRKFKDVSTKKILYL